MAGAFELIHRKGTTAEHNSFVGALGEITVDTTKTTAVVHDGLTAGGNPMASEAYVDSASATLMTQIANMAGASASFGTDTAQVIPLEPDDKEQMEWVARIPSSNEDIIEVGTDTVTFKKKARYEFRSDLTIHRAGSANNVTLKFDLVDGDDNIIKSVSEVVQFRVDSDNQISLNTLIDVDDTMLADGDLTIRVMMGADTTAGTVSVKHMNTIVALSQVGQPLIDLVGETGDRVDAVMHQKAVSELLDTKQTIGYDIEFFVGNEAGDFPTIREAVQEALKYKALNSNILTEYFSTAQKPVRVVITGRVDAPTPSQSTYLSLSHGDYSFIELRGTFNSRTRLSFYSCVPPIINCDLPDSGALIYHRIVNCTGVVIGNAVQPDTNSFGAITIKNLGIFGSDVIIGNATINNSVFYNTTIRGHSLTLTTTTLVNNAVFYLHSLILPSTFRPSLSGFFSPSFYGDPILRGFFSIYVVNLSFYANVSYLRYCFLRCVNYSGISFLCMNSDVEIQNATLTQSTFKVEENSTLTITQSLNLTYTRCYITILKSVVKLAVLDTSAVTGFSAGEPWCVKVLDGSTLKIQDTTNSCVFKLGTANGDFFVVQQSNLLINTIPTIPTAPASGYNIIKMTQGSQVTAPASINCNVTAIGTTANGLKLHI